METELDDSPFLHSQGNLLLDPVLLRAICRRSPIDEVDDSFFSTVAEHVLLSDTDHDLSKFDAWFGTRSSASLNRKPHPDGSEMTSSRGRRVKSVSLNEDHQWNNVIMPRSTQRPIVGKMSSSTDSGKIDKSHISSLISDDDDDDPSTDEEVCLVCGKSSLDDDDQIDLPDEDDALFTTQHLPLSDWGKPDNSLQSLVTVTGCTQHDFKASEDLNTSRHLLILCDGCDAQFHLECVGLSQVPASDWFCKRCLVEDTL
jgi:hypothetical protein